MRDSYESSWKKTAWWFQTPLKNIGRNGNLPQVEVKFKKIFELPPPRIYQGSILYYNCWPWSTNGGIYLGVSKTGKMGKKSLVTWNLENYLTSSWCTRESLEIRRRAHQSDSKSLPVQTKKSETCNRKPFQLSTNPLKQLFPMEMVVYL